MKTLFFISLFGFASIAARGQEAKHYWVIETNQHNKTYTIVRAYDSKHKLLFEETLHGKYLTVTKRKDRKFIDRFVMDRTKRDTMAWSSGKDRSN